MWEGFDEWAHYAVVQGIATYGRLLPDRTERVSREVEASLELAPWRPGDKDAAAQHSAYWRLSDIERARRDQQLRATPLEWAHEPAIHGRRSYEAQQAPLYYWLFAPLYRLTDTLPFLSRVWLLRLASLTVASTVIPIGFLVARRVLEADLPALGVVALLAAMPQLMIVVGRISNDRLAIPMGALLLLLMLRWKESPPSLSRSVSLGVALGLALLTKSYFLAIIPPVLVSIVLWAKTKGARRQAIILLACAVAISAWWYTRNWMLTQSLSGETIAIAAAATGSQFFDALFRVNWIRAIDFALLSQIWLGNWSFLAVRSWMYHFFYILAAISFAGLVLRFVRLKRPQPPAGNLFLLAGVTTSFLAALGYHAVRSFQTTGFSGTFGHYMFPAIVAEAILFSVGLETISPAFLVSAVMPFVTICFSALEFFGLHFVAIAYYSGFTGSPPNGGVPALQLSSLENGGFQLLLARLAQNKPAFLSPTVLAAIWGLFLAATLCVIALSVGIAISRRLASLSTPPQAQGDRSNAATAGD